MLLPGDEENFYIELSARILVLINFIVIPLRLTPLSIDLTSIDIYCVFYVCTIYSFHLLILFLALAFVLFHLRFHHNIVVLEMFVSY